MRLLKVENRDDHDSCIKMFHTLMYSYMFPLLNKCDFLLHLNLTL